jgi:hypothetical protein
MHECLLFVCATINKGKRLIGQVIEVKEKNGMRSEDEDEDNNNGPKWK